MRRRVWRRHLCWKINIRWSVVVLKLWIFRLRTIILFYFFVFYLKENCFCRYGKTARGLAIDWETSVAEAKETVDRWYTKKKKIPKFRNNFLLTQVRRSMGGESVARRDHTSRSIDRLHQDVDGPFASFAWYSQVI